MTLYVTATPMPPRRQNRWLRPLLLTVGGTLCMVCVALAALIWCLLPSRYEAIALPGLAAPVQVSFDADDIPYIRAGSLRDAAEALGYIHARDRLFQMDLMRRAAGGELAALFGPAALANDEEMRRLGLRRSAEADAAGLTVQARGLLQAYADGVNAWIAQRGRFASPEFILLGRPRPWTIVDSLLWGKMMGLWLSGNWRLQLERLALSQSQKREKIDALWPQVANAVPEEAAEAYSHAVAAAPGDAPAAPVLAVVAAQALGWVRHFPEAFTQPAQASNEWAVSGARTASGRPLLAGDPHLGFDFPSLWYLVRIDTPQGVLAGATAPGLPFIVIGHNNQVAWTFTSTGAAVQDVFIEHRTADGQGYETPDGPRPFTRRVERIAVAGHADVLLTVVSTRHGPVIGTTPDGRDLLTVEMANLAPGDTDADGLLMLNQARSVQEAGIAAGEITSPVQNLLVADTAGHIGFFTTGRVPIRKAGDGSWPVEGADGRYDWAGFARGAALPHSVDPPSGMLVNANNPTVGADFPVFLGRDNYGDWRARRIAELLAGAGPQTVESFGRIQLDVTSDFAREVLPRMLAVPMPAGAAAQAVALLRDWSGDMTMARPQPVIFNAWRQVFIAEVLQRNGVAAQGAPMLEDNFMFSLLGPDATPAAQAMWCGDAGCGAVLRDALDVAVAGLQQRYGADPANWRWGEVHAAIFAHPLFSRLPLIGGLGLRSIPVPGDSTTVDLSAFEVKAQNSDDFTAVRGPELRAVFDLADLDRSRFIIAPGQSGNLLDGFAANFLKRWQVGQYVELRATPQEVSQWIGMSPAARGE
jgi:penicillin G amidase